MKKWILTLGFVIPAALLAAGQQGPEPTKKPSELKKLEEDAAKAGKDVGSEAKKVGDVRTTRSWRNPGHGSRQR